MTSFSMARVSLKSPLTYSTLYAHSSSSMPRKSYEPSSYLSSSSTGRAYDGSSYHSTTSSRYSPATVVPSHASYGAASYTSTLRKRGRSPGGRPLPAGPGPQDAQGRKISFHNSRNNANTSSYRTSVHTMRASDTRSQPVRADHSTGLGRASPSYGKNTGSSLHKRTNSVSDLTKAYEKISLQSGSTSGLSRSRHYGSNLDISNSGLSTPDKVVKEDFRRLTSPTRTDTYGSMAHASSWSPKKSTLPDIRNASNNDRVSMHSPSPERSGYENTHAKRTMYANSRHSSQNSLAGGHSLDHNSNIKSTSPSPESRLDVGLVGLRNLGNTCFMNSVIQSLSNARLLLEYCLSNGYEEEINTSSSAMKGALVKSYAKMMRMLWEKSATYVTPTDFKSQISKFAPRFIGYNQQDAQEFLVYLLEGLHEDLNRVHQKKKRFIDDTCCVETISAGDKAINMWKHYITCDNSKIVDIFVGQLRSTLTCTECNYKSNTFDPFWQLSLPVKKSRSSTTLTDCLDLFTQQETLDGDERPKCAKCKERQRCTKRFSIQRFPKVLVIHLKRFNQGAYIRTKLSTLVDFPLEGLDMEPYAAEQCNVPQVYNLFAVISHSGSTVGGHYIADARHPYTGQWNHFNDIRVNSSTKHSMVSADAYVLFYELAEHTSRL